MNSLSDAYLVLTLGDDPAPRLDKALADVAPEGSGLSRSRIAKLIASGHVMRSHGEPAGAKDKPKSGEEYDILLSQPSDLENPEPQNLPIEIIHEDAELLVVNKPAGMVVHPAPGTPDGTLVNALLYHCENLEGVGTAGRPGIVHRIDKDTSGLLVVAKTQRAHQGLSAQFADHSIERLYTAFCIGSPSKADPRLAGLSGVGFETGGVIRIATNLARHKTDRKRMAVTKDRGKHAITRISVSEDYGQAALVQCRLETGRTHQIRVHLAHIGHRLIGDPVYGRDRKLRLSQESIEDQQFLIGFHRQALHATMLGFTHPITENQLKFEVDLDEDLTKLRRILVNSAK